MNLDNHHELQINHFMQKLATIYQKLISEIRCKMEQDDELNRITSSEVK